MLPEHSKPEATRPDTPLMTAIIIFLNGERYIAEAIESVLGQTEQDFELILVDDGSGPAATEIAKRYARMHPGRVVYTDHPGHENRGMSASRNAGLRLARGKYVGFLDADDIWHPEHIRVYARVLEEVPEIDVVVGRTLLWWSWTSPDTRDGVMDVEVPLWRVLEPPHVMLRMLQTRGRSVPAVCAIVARLDAVRAEGGFDEAFRSLYEDQVFFSRMFLNRRSMAIDVVLDKYRQHPESACHSEGGSEGNAKARPRFLAWLSAYFDAKGVTDRRLRAALAREIWRVRHPKLDRLSRLPERAVYWAFRKLPRPLRTRLAGPFHAMMSFTQGKPPPMDAAACALRARLLEGIELEGRTSDAVGVVVARHLNKPKAAAPA